jgi:hypothetical protein
MPYEAITIAGVGHERGPDELLPSIGRLEPMTALRKREIEDVAQDIAAQYESVAERGGQIVAGHTIQASERRISSWVILIANFPPS